MALRPPVITMATHTIPQALAEGTSTAPLVTTTTRGPTALVVPVVVALEVKVLRVGAIVPPVGVVPQVQE